jgi:hypothetical protein
MCSAQSGKFERTDRSVTTCLKAQDYRHDYGDGKRG